MTLEESSGNYHQLEELGGSRFEIAAGQPDIKGWEVRNETGRKIGRVTELLFDPGAEKVRYLIIHLEDNELGVDNGRKVMVPIDVAQLYDGNSDHLNARGILQKAGNAREDLSGSLANADFAADTQNNPGARELVILPIITAQLVRLPAYEKDGVSAETESIVQHIFEGLEEPGSAIEHSQTNIYADQNFNEDKFYSNRINEDSTKLPVVEERLELGKNQVETGSTRISSRIIERPVEAKINLKEEHVSIQRTVVDRPVSTTDEYPFKEEVLEIAEYAEVPVITREARVVEEIVLNKEVEYTETTIRDTIRNTIVDEERIEPKKET